MDINWDKILLSVNKYCEMNEKSFKNITKIPVLDLDQLCTFCGSQHDNLSFVCEMYREIYYKLY